MPQVNIDGVGVVNFPDSMSHDQIVSAIENDILPNHVRNSIAERAANPPATAQGDPNADPGLSIHDIGGAIGKGLAHFLGLPGNAQELGQMVQHPLSMPTSPIQMGFNAGRDLIQGRPSPVEGSTTEKVLGHVPVVGGVLQDIAAPGAQYAQGSAPTNQQNLGAITAGTQAAGTLATLHPAVSGAIESAVGRAGPAVEQSGLRTYADALAPEGSAMRPLAETIGSQLKGKIMSNPKAQLETAFDADRGPQLTSTDVPKFNNPARHQGQMQALQDAHPNAAIDDNGTHFTIRENQPAKTGNDISVNQQGADELAAAMPNGSGGLRGTLGRVGRDLGASAVGGAIGAAVGHPALGAAVASGAVEAANVLRNVVQSPLWRTVSGSTKMALGKAMQTGDFQNVISTGTQILAGQNLENDDFGHDSALHGLVNSFGNVPPPMLSQLLQQHDAMYINPDGTMVPVPHNIQKQTYEILSKP